MKLWLETVLGAIGSSSKNRFSPISTIFGFIKIDYETPPPFCPKPLFALLKGSVKSNPGFFLRNPAHWETFFRQLRSGH